MRTAGGHDDAYTNIFDQNCLDPLAQSSATADSGVQSLIVARSHTFVEIYHEISSTGILLLLLIQEGLSVTSKSMRTKLCQTCPGKRVVRWTDHLDMTITVDLGSKVSKVAKIRNRYNQVPHLTQDTNGKVTNSQKTPQTRAKRPALSQQVTTKHI